MEHSGLPNDNKPSRCRFLCIFSHLYADMYDLYVFSVTKVIHSVLSSFFLHCQFCQKCVFFRPWSANRHTILFFNSNRPPAPAIPCSNDVLSRHSSAVLFFQIMKFLLCTSAFWPNRSIYSVISMPIKGKNPKLYPRKHLFLYVCLPRFD